MKKAPRILILCLLAFPASLPAADFGLESVGVQGGAASPEDFDAGASFGVKVDVGTLYDRLTLVPSVSYWKASASELGVDLDATNLSAGADVVYYFSELRRGFYAGGGLRLNRVEVEAALPLGSFGALVVKSEDNRTNPAGIVGYAGNRFYLEAEYNAIESLGTLSLSLGVRFGD